MQKELRRDQIVKSKLFRRPLPSQKFDIKDFGEIKQKIFKFCTQYDDEKDEQLSSKDNSPTLNTFL